MHLKNYLFFFACLIWSVIFSGCHTNVKTGYAQRGKVEGYIFLTNEVFGNTDSSHIGVNLAGGDTASLLNTKRSMIIREHYLIDILPNRHYDESGYLKTDTASITIYDLEKQMFASFRRFLPDAEIIRKGKMGDDGSFSNKPDFDPFNGVMDENWTGKDTTISGRKNLLVSFHASPDDPMDPAHRIKFWIDKSDEYFPLQLSYTLSAKAGGGFVYKMQLPAPEGTAVMVTTLNYQPQNLPDSIQLLFDTWRKRMN